MPGQSPPAVRIDETPNPNAVRCRPSSPIPPLVATVAGGLQGRGIKPSRSYRTYAEAEDARDGLAMDLFRLPGVAGVLIHESGTWFSLIKEPAAAWGPLRSGITDVVKKMRPGPAGEPDRQAPGAGGA